MFVDAGDTAFLASYLGDTITREHAWQADFNHADAVIDQSDLSHFAGRLGTDCSTSKVGDDYVANVANLQDPGIRALMAQVGVSVTDVLATWDSWGWTYDQDAATLIAAASIETRDWSSVKRLYR
jgi:hypothetical protein